MILARSAVILTCLWGVSAAAVRSGKASVEWISASATCEAGKPVQTAVRLVLDEGWHTYWINPGEGGMKTSVKWELPPGWTAGELEHPVPKRFMTGELPGFGYDGTVIFPVKLTPPPDFTGEAKVKGKISWLTCNENQCVPGNAELELSVAAGNLSTTDETKVIQSALAKIPQPQQGWVLLKVTEKPDVVVLRIEAQISHPLDLNDYEVFPATPQVIDPAAKIQFTKNGAEWNAEVPKSEYAPKPINELTLVLGGKAQQPPISLTWNKK